MSQQPHKRRPWTNRILELVDEGVTEHERILDAAISYVPMGHAFRQREQRRLALLRDKGRPERPPREELPLSVIHRIGARDVVTQALRGLVDRGQLERDGSHYRRKGTP